MPSFEYKVVPAPKRGEKVRGIKGTEGRFAQTLEDAMNAMGADGWEYQRTDTLPCEERVGLTGRTTVFQNMLVFRRVVATATDTLAPRLISPPIPVVAAPAVAAPIPSVVPAPLVRVADTLGQGRLVAPVRTDPAAGVATVTDPRVAAK